MADEHGGAAVALDAEAGRLAVVDDGEPEAVYAGLAAFARQNGVEPAPDALRLTANRAVLRYRAARCAVIGYRGYAYWLDVLADQAEAELPAPVPEPAELREIVRAAWRERYAEQAGWPEETDNTRLNRAFAALNRNGIVARADFACCQRCAGQEIFDEFPEDGAPAGFVFFHQQDTERAARSGVLCLGFGGFAPLEPGTGRRVRHAPNGDPSHVAVAQRTVDALRAEGLDTAWDGTAGQRITVRLDWQARIGPV